MGRCWVGKRAMQEIPQPARIGSAKKVLLRVLRAARAEKLKESERRKHGAHSCERQGAVRARQRKPPAQTRRNRDPAEGQVPYARSHGRELTPSAEWRPMPLRRLAGLLSSCAFSSAACLPSGLNERWTCEPDSNVSRPLSNPDAVADDSGAFGVIECQTTCGPPVLRCAAVATDGGPPRANCPVCTF